MIRMIEPNAWTAVVGVLVAIAVGSYLYRSGARRPRCEARAYTADEHASGAPVTVRPVRNDGRNWREPTARQRSADRYRDIDRKTPSLARTVTNAVNHGLFGRRRPAGVGLHPVAMSAGAPSGQPRGVPRSHKTLYRADLGGALPFGMPTAADDVHLAIRAVRLHTPRQWPGGVYCSNDRSPFPCRLRRWGEETLLSAGWSAEDIAALGRQADSDDPPPAR
jgi:hypothetical protein